MQRCLQFHVDGEGKWHERRTGAFSWKLETRKRLERPGYGANLTVSCAIGEMRMPIAGSANAENETNRRKIMDETHSAVSAIKRRARRTGQLHDRIRAASRRCHSMEAASRALVRSIILSDTPYHQAPLDGIASPYGDASAAACT